MLEVESGRVSRLTLTATDPLGRGLVWPQRLRVTLGYETGVQDVPVYLDTDSVTLLQAVGRPAPLFVLPSGAGLGYGLFVLDTASREYLLQHVEAVEDPLTRGSAWVTLWENMLESHVAAGDFLDAAVRALATETDEQNTQRVLSYATRAFWRYLDADERARRAPALEAMLWAGIGRATTSSEKSAWFAAFRDVALTPTSVASIEALWRRDDAIAGLTLAEMDEITMALELAVREGTAVARDPADPVRSDAESRSQGAVCIHDAGAFGGSCGSRGGIRSVSPDREPAPRALGRRCAGVSESPLAGDARAAVHTTRSRPVARDPAHGRHLLSDALDRRDTGRPPVASGRCDRSGFSGAGTAVSGAPSLDDPQRRGRTVQGGSVTAWTRSSRLSSPLCARPASGSALAAGH